MSPYIKPKTKKAIKMKKTLLTLFTVGLFNFANAQVSAYTFAGSSGTYTAFSTGTSIATGIQDDSVITAKPIGFTFNYNGTNYTTFGANINGWISLGSTAPVSSYTPISSGTTNNVISALGRDLQLGYSAAGSYTSGSPTVTMAVGGTTGFVVGDFFVTSTGFAPGTTVTAVGATTLTLSANATSTGTAGTYTVMGNIQYLTAGIAPNRTCTIQWTRARRYSATASVYQNNFFNFQIKLTETSNTIAFVYGPFQTNSTSSKYEVGLRGSANTDFNNRKTTTNWASTTAGTLNTDTCSLTTTVKPASGQTFTWTPPPVCTGAPTAGTASAPTSACSGVSFNLVLTGYTPNVSGLTFQWQSSTSLGGTYSNIPLATTTTFATTQTTTMYYKCMVSCSGGTAVASNIVTVTLTAPASCYCTPVHSVACNTTNNIDSVVIVGTTLSNIQTGCTSTNGTAYTVYPATGTTTASLTGGTIYTFKVTTTSNNIISVWIDYNQNGTYDASEWNQISTTSVANTPNYASITIPSSATAGLTGMRIRSRSNGSSNGSTDACTSFASGETEDYKVTIIAATPCTGAPTAGTASGPTGACSGISFNLVLTGYSSGVSGITFQWQSSSTIGGTYSNISGATSPTYAASLTATTYYKCLVSCSGGTAVASNIVTVTLNAPSACYCTPASTNCLTTDKITNVTISTINNTTTCGTAGYSSYTTPTATFNQAVSYPITVTVGATSQYVGVWIDYNQNGTFDASEFTYLGTGSLTITSAIVIPGTATLGATKMRVRTRWNSTLTGADACLAYTYGETEDYAVTIAAGTACTGTPTAGTASATNDSACSGTSFNLILTGYTSGVAGITFQWQSSSTSGGTYTDISGATTATYATTQTATTYYKCVVTCSGGTPVSSNIITVHLTPIMNCYCTSNATNTSDEDIFNVTVGTLNNTSTCLTTGGTGSVLNKYSNYTAVAAPILSRTAATSFSVSIGTCGTSAYTSAFKICIDYNKNGSFAETGETVYTSDTATGAYTKTGTFTVPTSASSGSTLMRVVNTETDFANTIDSCGTYGYGETEDYLVSIPSLVGIEENEMLNTISVYPNPTTGLFNITTSNANFTQLTISVIDIQGKEVFNTSDKNYSANYNKQINLEGLAKGIYYIRLNTGAGVKTQKLIIQ